MNSQGWSLIDTSLGLAISAWLLTGGLMALWQIQQAGERMRWLNEWSTHEAWVKQLISHRMGRFGAPLAQRSAPGHWSLESPWPMLSTSDASRGPWIFSHWSQHTALNCQGGESLSPRLADAFSFVSPDKLMCQNPLHAGNVRQTLSAGIRGWVVQVAVQNRNDPPSFQWQTLAPAHTGEGVWAIRVCWRTAPEHAMAEPSATDRTSQAWDCDLPLLRSAHRDRWQWLAHWNSRQRLP
ncbi:MAG: hypothetical protein RL307_1497 [Pseudomonadota bacterium]